VKHDDPLAYGVIRKQKLVVMIAMPPVWFSRSGSTSFSYEYDDTLPVLLALGRENGRSSKDNEAAKLKWIDDIEQKQDMRKRARRWELALAMVSFYVNQTHDYARELKLETMAD
jgi:hypothetical protein